MVCIIILTQHLNFKYINPYIFTLLHHILFNTCMYLYIIILLNMFDYLSVMRLLHHLFAFAATHLKLILETKGLLKNQENISAKLQQ